MECSRCVPLRWRHNDRDGVSNHQPRDYLLNRLFRRKSKKTAKLRVTGLCAGNSPVPGEFPAQMASYAENVSIWWRHNGLHYWEPLKNIKPYHVGLAYLGKQGNILDTGALSPDRDRGNRKKRILFSCLRVNLSDMQHFNDTKCKRIFILPFKFVAINVKQNYIECLLQKSADNGLSLA